MPQLDRFPSAGICTFWILAGFWSLMTADDFAAHASETAATETETARQLYDNQLKPLFRQRCYACHGALKQESGLRLDTVSLMRSGGDSGPVIPTENLEGESDVGTSLLWERVAAEDSYMRMPPEHEGEAFSSEQLAWLQRWLAAGAPGPDDELPEADPSEHWAFRPRVRPEVPEVPMAEGEPTKVNPIDAFLARSHQEHGLNPQREATRLELVRRLYLDLIGLPPTREEWKRIEADSSPTWYDDLVDRLLQDPRHGERWARHWMDVWRYSDWWGLGDQLRNSQKHIWHWRDWIIESLNQDVPYDEMVRQMLAADELYPNDLDKLRASGYLARNYFLFNRNQWMEEVVEHVGKGFLGLTMNCAKCHDHKYDPIRQEDFYRMRAIFEPYHVRMDVRPGEPDPARDGVPRAFDRDLETPTYLFIRGQESQPDQSTVIEPGVPTFLEMSQEMEVQPVALPIEASRPERRSWVLENHISAAAAKLETAERQFEEARQRLQPVEKEGQELFESESESQSESDSDEADESRETDIDSDPDETGQSDETGETGEANRLQAQWLHEKRKWELAQAEWSSLELRVEATRARWKCEDLEDSEQQEACSESARVAAEAASRAERQLEVARLRATVAQRELQRHDAEPDQRESIDKELATARESLQKAEAELESPGESFTPFIGAAWTPTRFLFSGQDDPSLDFPATSSGRRAALAEWITADDNPLTARVAANQIWMRHFGSPLAASVFDLGRAAPAPEHPELLDWLACELVESGWSMKHLHRLIVQSAAYRRSSSLLDREENLSKDPDNRHWWRRNPIRLESQVVRDSILALAGDLDSTRGGPSVLPADQDNSTRRSLYFFHSNNDRNQFLTMFDDALVKECYQREQSIVPQQALALSNSRIIHDAAPRIVRQLEAGRELGLVGDHDGEEGRSASENGGVSENGGDSESGDAAEARSAADRGKLEDERFIQRAFKYILGMEADDQELSVSLDAMQSWRNASESEAEAGDAEVDPARVYFIWALLNHNDFVTLR